jgi:hypothetical protein
MDDADPKYGYDGFGGFGIDDAMNNMFPGYAQVRSLAYLKV